MPPLLLLGLCSASSSVATCAAAAVLLGGVVAMKGGLGVVPSARGLRSSPSSSALTRCARFFFLALALAPRDARLSAVAGVLVVHGTSSSSAPSLPLSSLYLLLLLPLAEAAAAAERRGRLLGVSASPDSSRLAAELAARGGDAALVRFIVAVAVDRAGESARRLKLTRLESCAARVGASERRAKLARNTTRVVVVVVVVGVGVRAARSWSCVKKEARVRQEHDDARGTTVARCVITI